MSGNQCRDVKGPSESAWKQRPVYIWLSEQSRLPPQSGHSPYYRKKFEIRGPTGEDDICRGGFLRDVANIDGTVPN